MLTLAALRAHLVGCMLVLSGLETMEYRSSVFTSSCGKQLKVKTIQNMRAYPKNCSFAVCRVDDNFESYSLSLNFIETELTQCLSSVGVGYPSPLNT